MLAKLRGTGPSVDSAVRVGDEPDGAGLQMERAFIGPYAREP